MLPTAGLSDQVTAAFELLATVAVKAWVCEGVRVTLAGVSETLTDVASFNCRAKLAEALPALAVSVAVCAVLTDDTVAVNPALVALAGTFTVVGTKTAALLLDYLGYDGVGDRIRSAVGAVLRAGRVVTPDMGGKAGTTDMTAAVIRALK